MSVPSWLREKYWAQYELEIFNLNVRLGQIVMNKPTKYRCNYGDRIIQNGLDAQKFARAANSIRMNENTSKERFETRQSYLRNVIVYINALSTISDIFLELNRSVDGIKSERLDKEEQYIGETCREIIVMVQNLMKSDREVFNGKKMIKKNDTTET